MFKIIFFLIFSSYSLFALDAYEVYLKEYYTHDGEFFISLRTWKKDGQIHYLLVNPHTLKTHISALKPQKIDTLQEPFSKTLLAKVLQHNGVFNEAFKTTPKTIFLTMDMCPSLKPDYEKAFIDELTSHHGKTPLAIAITSGWIQKHESSFEELIHNPLLEITWINHSHSHFYDKNLPHHQNFMLHVSTDVQSEILELEKNLIQRGLTPSIFFRFPGLVFDEALVRKVKEEFFLLPIGSRAWIAKGEKVKNGSFVLIHGNKNEPQGIKSLKEQLPTISKSYSFKPLYEAF